MAVAHYTNSGIQAPWLYDVLSSRGLDYWVSILTNFRRY
jgi:hypothetical protein